MPSPSPRIPSPQSTSTIEVIDPRWLLKAFGLAVAIALLLAYVTLCLLFYQGQWQLVLAPSATVASTPAALNLNFEPVTFGPTHLTGWLIPSDSPADPTVLLLHSGTGNMADALPSAQTLHAARLNVLLFDYRGFGAAPGPHPTQARMQQDAATAFDYLVHTRGLTPASILLYGEGVGASVAASLAAHLAAAHTDTAALILISPTGDLTAQVRRDSRAHLAPVSLLFHETFPLARPLQTLNLPKLIVTTDSSDTPAQSRLNLKEVSDPKLTVELRHPDPAEPLRSLNRFLDTYLPRASQQLHR